MKTHFVESYVFDLTFQSVFDNKTVIIPIEVTLVFFSFVGSPMLLSFFPLDYSNDSSG